MFLPAVSSTRKPSHARFYGRPLRTKRRTYDTTGGSKPQPVPCRSLVCSYRLLPLWRPCTTGLGLVLVMLQPADSSNCQVCARQASSILSSDQFRSAGFFLNPVVLTGAWAAGAYKYVPSLLGHLLDFQITTISTSISVQCTVTVASTQCMAKKLRHTGLKQLSVVGSIAAMTRPHLRMMPARRQL